MAEKKDVKQASLGISLADIKYTNHLFLNLLYNLSKYPHTQRSKRLVHKVFLTLMKKCIRVSKAKKVNLVN